MPAGAGAQSGERPRTASTRFDWTMRKRILGHLVCPMCVYEPLTLAVIPTDDLHSLRDVLGGKCSPQTPSEPLLQMPPTRKTPGPAGSHTTFLAYGLGRSSSPSGAGRWRTEAAQREGVRCECIVIALLTRPSVPAIRMSLSVHLRYLGCMPILNPE